jgi:hypothetical protein
LYLFGGWLGWACSAPIERTAKRLNNASRLNSASKLRLSRALLYLVSPAATHEALELELELELNPVAGRQQR